MMNNTEAEIVAIRLWNTTADQYNQWDNLSNAEREELTQSVAQTFHLE